MVECGCIRKDYSMRRDDHIDKQIGNTRYIEDYDVPSNTAVGEIVGASIGETVGISVGISVGE